MEFFFVQLHARLSVSTDNEPCIHHQQAESLITSCHEPHKIAKSCIGCHCQTACSMSKNDHSYGYRGQFYYIIDVCYHTQQRRSTLTENRFCKLSYKPPKMTYRHRCHWQFPQENCADIKTAKSEETRLNAHSFLNGTFRLRRDRFEFSGKKNQTAHDNSKLAMNEQQPHHHVWLREMPLKEANEASF